MPWARDEQLPPLWPSMIRGLMPRENNLAMAFTCCISRNRLHARRPPANLGRPSGYTEQDDHLTRQLLAHLSRAIKTILAITIWLRASPATSCRSHANSIPEVMGMGKSPPTFTALTEPIKVAISNGTTPETASSPGACWKKGCVWFNSSTGVILPAATGSPTGTRTPTFKKPTPCRQKSWTSLRLP